MKRIITILVFLLIGLNAQSQFVTIPDANFVNWLVANGFNSALVGNQLDTTNNLVVNTNVVQCSNANISNLSGIEYFDNLQLLDCSNNQISNIQRLPNTLQTLYCNNNQILSIQQIPDSLVILNCSFNSQQTFHYLILFCMS